MVMTRAAEFYFLLSQEKSNEMEFSHAETKKYSDKSLNLMNRQKIAITAGGCFNISLYGPRIAWSYS